MTLHIHIETASVKWKGAFPRMKAKMEQAAAAAFARAKKPAAFARRDFEVNIILATDARIKALNRLYRGQDKPTNVLSFPQIGMEPAALEEFPGKMPVPLGDVILAAGTVFRECREQDKTLENHTVHLVVHGILHLLGHDHMKKKEAETMEKLECDILKSLGYPPPYHETATENDRTPAHGRRSR